MELSASTPEAAPAACCGAPQRPSASELCDRGLRRNRLEPFELAGSTLHSEGLAAQFSLQCRGPAIASVRFKVSTCATLLAYCELLAELAVECSIAEGGKFTAPLLVSELPGVPVYKRNRAALAVAAFRSALTRAGSPRST